MQREKTTPTFPTRAQEWLTENYCPTSRYRNHVLDQFVRKFGFAILDRETAKFIRPYGPLLEIGAGLGYWAYELGRLEIQVVPTDPNPKERWPNTPTWTHVESLSAEEAIARYPEMNLLISWPDNKSEWAAKALPEFRGRYLLYVGEERGGCTGTSRMFDIPEAEFEFQERHNIPTFFHVSDRLEV